MWSAAGVVCAAGRGSTEGAERRLEKGGSGGTGQDGTGGHEGKTGVGGMSG